MLTFAQIERIIGGDNKRKGADLMPDYQKMYFELMARVADATDLLIEAQQKCEEEYIEAADGEQGQ